MLQEASAITRAHARAPEGDETELREASRKGERVLLEEQRKEYYGGSAKGSWRVI